MDQELNSYGIELETKLKLLSMPIAIKVIKTESEIPAGAKRPLGDMGSHLSLCQALAMSRREGQVIAMLKQDNWCPYPVIALGLVAAPEFFLEGKNVIPGGRSPQGAKNWTKRYPRLEAGKYIGMVSAPLKSATFEPDVVAMYVNSVQLGRVLSSLSYDSGKDLESRICSDAACGYYIVPVMQGKEAVLSVPCGGDRRRAIARDDELVISLSVQKLRDLIKFMRKMDEAGHTFPRPPDMVAEGSQPANYRELVKILGFLNP